jgi:hypothetical protein
MLTTVLIVSLYSTLCPAYAALGYRLGKDWKLITQND